MTQQTWFTEIESPVGRLRLVADEVGVRHIQFLNGRGAAPPRDETWVEHARKLRPIADQLTAYFAGRREQFDLSLAPEGTPFQQRVWTALCEIPFGETISYGELARRVGSPKAARAVGLANGQNPVAIVIPCHRVIGSDGSLTGYGGGLPIKQKLLALEQKQLTLV